MMKCMKINGVSKLLSFFSKFAPFLLFNSHNYQKLVVFFPIFTYPSNPRFIFMMFLALSFLIVSIFMGSSLKPSSDDCDQDSQHDSISFLSILESYPLSYIVDEEILDDAHSFADIIDKDDQHHSSSFHSMLESCPLSYIVDEEILDETYSFTDIVDKDDQEVIPSVLHLELERATQSHDQEFIPRVVHLELIEGAIGSHEDCKDIIPCFVQLKAIEGSIGSHEENKVYDGYEGDKDDIDSIEDDNDDDNVDDDNDDLKIRVEEFIAKNMRKWKEEMINDKLLCLEY